MQKSIRKQPQTSRVAIAKPGVMTPKPNPTKSFGLVKNSQKPRVSVLFQPLSARSRKSMALEPRHSLTPPDTKFKRKYSKSLINLSELTKFVNFPPMAEFKVQPITLIPPKAAPKRPGSKVSKKSKKPPQDGNVTARRLAKTTSVMLIQPKPKLAKK